jgi:hypothetical protein
MTFPAGFVLLPKLAMLMFKEPLRIFLTFYGVWEIPCALIRVRCNIIGFTSDEIIKWSEEGKRS